MDDRVIFDHQGVIVGYTDLLVQQKRFPIKNITHVGQRMLKPKYFLARLFMFSGIPFIFASNWYPIFGLILMLAGLIFFKIAKVRYALVIHTVEGTYHPLIKEDIQDIENVAAALNVALIMKSAVQ